MTISELIQQLQQLQMKCSKQEVSVWDEDLDMETSLLEVYINGAGQVELKIGEE